MKKSLLMLGLAVLLLMPTVVHGQTNAAVETMVFDSTDNYIGACSLTATSTWTLTEELAVSKFQMWYKWQTGETELPITVTKDGAAFATFTATRSVCDSYQTSWCNADYAINKTFPAGTYTTTIANAYQCLKPGSTGTVRLFSTGATAAASNTNETPNLIATANTNQANANTATANTNVLNTNTSAAVTTNTNHTSSTASTEDGDGNVLTFVLIGIIIILVVVIVAMYMKCPKNVVGK